MSTVPAERRGPAGPWSGLALGLALGAGWGVLARLFMRLVSTTPEFSWVGTLMIVVLSALFGAGVGAAAGARAAGRSRWWRLAALPGLVLFAGQGLVLLPGAVGVAVAAALRRRPVQVVLCVGGLAGTLGPLLATGEVPSTPSAWAGLALLVVATVLLGLALHAWWAPWRPAVPADGEPAAPARV